jgi:WD40 repeat protein
MCSTATVRPVAFSADGRLVAVRSMNTATYIIETATGKVVQRLGPEPPEEWRDFVELAFSPDGKYLATWNDFDHTIVVWDLTASKEWLRIVDKKKHGEVHFAWSPDGRMLAIGTSKVQLWEMATQKLRHEFSGHAGDIRALAFSPDCRLLATGSVDTTVLIWDIAGRLLD